MYILGLDHQRSECYCPLQTRTNLEIPFNLNDSERRNIQGVHPKKTSWYVNHYKKQDVYCRVKKTLERQV